MIARFDHVYIDVDSIGFGEDFFDAIDKALYSCNILLAVIGKGWLNASDDYGRRIDNPDDFVRYEIATALENKAVVIPVLVDGARMPRSSDLPEDIALLVRKNAISIRHESFHADVEKLIKAVKSILDKEEARIEAEIRKAAEAEARKKEEARIERQKIKAAEAESRKEKDTTNQSHAHSKREANKSRRQKVRTEGHSAIELRMHENAASNQSGINTQKTIDKKKGLEDAKEKKLEIPIVLQLLIALFIGFVLFNMLMAIS